MGWHKGWADTRYINTLPRNFLQRGGWADNMYFTVYEISYLLEHTNFYQVGEEDHHKLVLVLPGSVVELQVQHWRESLSLQDGVHQNIDHQVGVMGPRQEVDIARHTIAMADYSSQMSSA